jgi:hypothetical protein
MFYKVLLIALLSLACSACSRDGCMPGGDSQPPEVDIDKLGRELELQLPPGTQVLGMESESGGPDDAIFVKLRVPSAHAEQFIRTCGVTSFLSNAADLLGPDRGFWDPHHAKALRVGRVPMHASRGTIIGVDDSGADALLVYVVNHGT